MAVSENPMSMSDNTLSEIPRSLHEETPKEKLEGSLAEKPVGKEPLRTVDFGFLPIPSFCRYDPDKPFKLGYSVALVFAAASTFSTFYSIVYIAYY